MNFAKTALSLVHLVPLLPLFGALINGAITFSGKKVPKGLTAFIACGSLFLAFLISAGTFLYVTQLPSESRELTITLFPWIDIGNFKADVAFLIDPLSLTMMLVVTGVGSLIHLYSVGYMHDDPSFSRYFTYLNLFCFAMLTLVMGANIPMMFIGWEGVGLCSYLLIGFWFTDPEKATAGMKAFVVNRIGDFAFIVGFLLLYWTLQSSGSATVTFTEIREAAPMLMGKTWNGVPVVMLVTLLFFIGATGKSAQIPLYVWLPDAMAGPTPVSALIHAATMVTAGVYMIGRTSFLYSMAPETRMIVSTIGYATAIFSALIAFAQNDIKKVLAYSTVSQLGFMFGAMGTGAYTAGIFHLVTHAFFKACLFLGSGSVIHAMGGEQDIQKMGGLKAYLPITYRTFLIATLAIAGIFPFAGFFSKDEILWQTFNAYPWLWAVGVVAAAGTSIYMFRMVTLTFFGECRADEQTKHHLHESPATMTIPLIVLAALSIVGGFLAIPESLQRLVGLENANFFERWLEPVFVLPKAHAMAPLVTEYGLMALSLAIAVVGSATGYVLYSKRKDIPAALVARFPAIHRAMLNKFYVDEIYQALFVNNLLRLNNFLAKFDLKVVDGLVNLTGFLTKVSAYISGGFDRIFVDGLVNLVGNIARWAGAGLRRAQSGQIQTYLYYAAGGVLLVMLYRLL
jgi:NADH-quinone oxidoreductase subunit L